MSTKTNTNDGQFSKGTSGNPSGRPPGSPNKSRLIMEASLEGESQGLIRKAIKLALAGDTHALRLCLDRLLPPGRDRLVHFDMPLIRGLEEAPAISEGHLTPQEGEVIGRMLAQHAKSTVPQDVNPRLQRLEQLHENEVAIHPE